MGNNEKNGKEVANRILNSAAEPEPEYWNSPDGKIAIKLNMKLGDMAILAMNSAGDQAKAVGLFVYSDGSVTIVGCQDKDTTRQILVNATLSLNALPDR